MKLFVLSLLLLAVYSNIHLNQKYQDYIHAKKPLTILKAKQIYNIYTSQYQKDTYRFGVFFETLKSIISHNLKNLTWTKGINDFTDMTEDQFKQTKLMAPQQCSATNTFSIKKSDLAYPLSYQWNDYGVVTPVKNQGSCGSCWAFSTVGAIQAHWNILGKGKNVIFSEQQLVDCAGKFNNFGCMGGLPSQAFQYLKHVGGIQLSSTYPYVGKDGNCIFNSNLVQGKVRYGSYNITAGDQNELADRLYNVGPISIAYQVIAGFKDYKSGVYVPPTQCGTTPDDVNHATLATGYGIMKGVQFWNIKNSWGATWGDKGYFKISRNNNTCAISQCNAYPLIDAPNLSNLRGQ